MLLAQRIAVVIPAFNERAKIDATIRSVPGFVDHVIVVDDGSDDGTGRRARRSRRRGLEVIVHPKNRGVGAAIATGYRRALEQGAAAVAVMAGDGQMDPADLSRVVLPVLRGEADYVKGNRLCWPGVTRLMPRLRWIGNHVLTRLTQLTSGYPHVGDSQCGYTAASAAVLAALDLDRVYPRYGYPNDLLARLAVVEARVRDVPVRPVYGPDWRSGIRLWTVVPMLALLAWSWARRVYAQRIVRSETARIDRDRVFELERPRCASSS